MSKLILASASPRRQHLLTRVGIPFTIEPADIDERTRPGEAPQDYVLRMAHGKADRIARRHPEAFVLGADTIVTIDHEILGKPQDEADAFQMLRRLSGRSHTVITGLALLHHNQGFAEQDAVSTHIRFRPLSDDEIKAYIATSEPLDKAGSYAIQGGAGAFVTARDGSYTNAVGLPVQRTTELLTHAAFSLPQKTTHDATGE